MNESARRPSSFKSNYESSQKWLIQCVLNAGFLAWKGMAERALSNYAPDLLDLPMVS